MNIVNLKVVRESGMECLHVPGGAKLSSVTITILVSRIDEAEREHYVPFNRSWKLETIQQDRNTLR